MPQAQRNPANYRDSAGLSGPLPAPVPAPTEPLPTEPLPTEPGCACALPDLEGRPDRSEQPARCRQFCISAMSALAISCTFCSIGKRSIACRSAVCTPPFRSAARPALSPNASVAKARQELSTRRTQAGWAGAARTARAVASTKPAWRHADEPPSS